MQDPAGSPGLVEHTSSKILLFFLFLRLLLQGHAKRVFATFGFLEPIEVIPSNTSSNTRG